MYDENNPPLFPETIRSKYGIHSSITIDGFGGLRMTDSFRSASIDKELQGTVNLCGDEEVTQEWFESVVRFVQENAEVLLEKSLITFVEWYEEAQSEMGDELPEIQSYEELKTHCVVLNVHIQSEFTDDMPHFGLEFDCDWDIEHGAGVLFKGLEILDSGQASISF